MLKIERNIPIAKPRVTARRNGRRTIYPFAKMKVGDSFLVQTGNDRVAQVKKRSSVINCASKHKPKKFTTRLVADGLRVWRIV